LSPKIKKLFNNKSPLVWWHLVTAIFCSLLIYFFSVPYAKMFFWTSLSINLYLRLIEINLKSLVLISKEQPGLLAVFGAARIIILGSIVAFLFFKFKYNLIVIGSAMLFFQIVLIVGGLILNNYESHYRTNSRPIS